MIIDFIADLHGHFPELEGGDLLIVAGDLTATDTIDEYTKFIRWFRFQKYIKKILIAGNHDNRLVGPWPGDTKGPFRVDKLFYDFDYLCDSGTEFEGLKIWGSPWTQRFKNMNPRCMAFTVDTEEELAEKWALVPDDIDILVTHGPSWGILDQVKGLNVGSKSLLKRVMEINPTVHCFGHIHEKHGYFFQPAWGSQKQRWRINASYVNEYYEPVNKPIRIEL